MRIYILITFMFILSCSQNESYKQEKCSELIPIEKTNKLKISDILPSFSGVTNEGKDFSFLSFKRKYLFIYFKKHGVYGLLNEEIKYNDLGKLAAEKQVDMLIESDLKLAKIYGIELTEDHHIKNNTLVVADENNVLKSIYVNVCEDDIVKIMRNIE